MQNKYLSSNLRLLKYIMSHLHFAVLILVEERITVLPAKSDSNVVFCLQSY